MAPDEQRTDRALPPSFVARLLKQLRSCDQPLIQLWAWPWSGKRLLFEVLTERFPGDWVKLPAHGALVDRLASGPRWLVVEGDYRAGELLDAAGRLRPEQRLVLPVERRLAGEILPQRLIEPAAMLLQPAETEEMFAGATGAQVGELLRLSDGWIGPLIWLRGRWRGEQSPETELGSARFATRFHQRVTGRLDVGIFDAMIESSVAENLDADLWRRVWIARPEKLAALERLIAEWGWLLSDPQAAPRLPRLIQRATRARLPPPERRRAIHRRLALAAHALGLTAEAERYLSLAGDAARLARLRALGPPASVPASSVPASSVPAASVPAASVPAASVSPSSVPPAIGGRGPGVPGGAWPRFSLQLLGQAVIRRIESDGSERELEWRLRRAFQSVAFLALAPDRRATKDQLVDAIWHGARESTIAKNFHPTLSAARSTLGHREVFAYSQGLYTLNPELDWWIDCERFEELIREGRQLLEGSAGEPARALDRWRSAWRLYRGELLYGVEAAWLEERRAVLYRNYVELLRAIGDLCVRLGRGPLALDAYRSLLLEEPFEERVHLAVMELYARQGRRDLVRRQFVRMQELLLRELNVEPVEETQERYHQLMR